MKTNSFAAALTALIVFVLSGILLCCCFVSPLGMQYSEHVIYLFWIVLLDMIRSLTKLVRNLVLHAPVCQLLIA
jgi:hypothetical protein